MEDVQNESKNKVVEKVIEKEIIAKEIISDNSENVIEGEKRKPFDKWFKFNHKYMTICIYSLFVVFWAAIIIVLISNWKDTKSFVYNLFDVLSPFFIALLIAYFLSPLVDNLNNFIQKYIA